MKLTKEDKDCLKHFGNLDRDMPQIERAISVTTYKFRGERISREKTIELLGRKKYLAGISRSAFHWDSVQKTENGECVFFDSSKLFREK